MLLGVLTVLGLLAARDIENGLGALRETQSRLADGLGMACGLVGAAVAVRGVIGLFDGLGGVAWFGLIVGGLGIESCWKQLRADGHPQDRIHAHLTGMIGAAAGFLAAFVLFGMGRLLQGDILEGGAGVVAAVVVVVGASQLLIRWWCTRWDARRSATPD